ncbi:hypothetical protein [Sulfitobacter sp. S190]|uniref:D-alanine--D-alanine ligase family protein n=1 Tax=Sulfitobacter sp. S190 TaxID=2867022 RepID=UPI0021A46F31|nr:hypothetical protein [Sulfitobacter sp. S190]UWR21611.1 hypothetical protein K3756_13040 [Sulfitobacter sp. S190]
MQLLHLVGATNNDFYHDLSCTYHQSTLVLDRMPAHVLRVDPRGALHLRRAGSVEERGTDLSEVAQLCTDIDLMVPFMFCPDGMMVWREMFETVFKVPVVGPPLSATVASTSKWQTKAIAKLAGVRSPDAVRLSRGAPGPAWTGPCIVKPDSEDNSIGLSLVQDPADLPRALADAWACGDSVLVEQYVPGREIRVGVLDINGEARVLPILEYHVSEAHPIRRREDKVDISEDGSVTRKTWEAPPLETSCPATLGTDLLEQVSACALEMHSALGSRDYSLFDMRIDTASGAPYLLEACSFWTFAPISILSRMVEAAGLDLKDVTRQVFEQAAARDTRDRHGPIASRA